MSLKLGSTRQYEGCIQATTFVLQDEGDYRAQDILAELANPNRQYTILLPPRQDLLMLQDTMLHLSLDSSAVLNSLLLHVVNGSWPLERFRNFDSDPLQPAGPEEDSVLP